MASTSAAPEPSAFDRAKSWAIENLFNSRLNTVISVVLLLALAWIVPKLLSWALFDAVFARDAAACRNAHGACWGFVAEKIRLMTFGTYPFDQHWRPLVAMTLLLGLIGAAMKTSWWGRGLVLAWLAGVPLIWLLMRGGEKWGGLPLTLILSANGIIFSFPLAVMLALGRRSELPAIKALSIGFIEIVRGVPLITVLFMASLMIPLFLPEGMTIGKVLRAQIGFILFAAAYEAEVIRGGLQAIPKGQAEAADALGLSYWHKTGFIVLPQALKLVIPPMVNTFIGFFKDTSLVIIISLFDFLGAVRLAASDVEWRPFYVEGLVFAGMVYFVFCYTMATYARKLEQRLNTGNR
jgi:general L-amino acid transport system permease protein